MPDINIKYPMDSIYRQSLPSLSTDLNFQILSWYDTDENKDLENDESEMVYKIYIFGSTSNCENVCVIIPNFTPYFYILIPDSLQDKWNPYFTEEVKRGLSKRFKSELKDVKMYEKMKIKGFTNFKKFKFLKLVFSTLNSYRRAKYYFYPTKMGSQELDSKKLPRFTNISQEGLFFEIYEHNIEPFIRFSHIQNIDLAGWITVKNKNLIVPEEKLTSCQYEYIVKWANVERNEDVKLCKFIVASFDIECVSENRKSFPDPSKPNDMVVQIGTTFAKFGTNEYVKHIVTLGSKIDNNCDAVDGVIIDVCKTEKELLKKWSDVMRKVNPDFIIGYNIYNFDWPYLDKRTKVLECEYYLNRLSKIVHIEAVLKSDKLSSCAYGDNNIKYINIPGATSLDLFLLIKREHNLEDYTLNNVSEVFLKDKKDDLPHDELFRKIDGPSSDIAIIAKYCAQDTFLVYKLLKKLNIMPNIISMANITKIPVHYVEVKGQQIKVFSQLLDESRKENFLIPTVRQDDTNDESFTGATVLTATPGAYYQPIVGLDFASLYPSIMISNNYCYSTIVENEEYLDLPNVEYKTIYWDDVNGKKCQVTFVQNHEGLLTKLLNKLWKKRKEIRKEMKTTKDEDYYNVLNGQQLAYKVSMNSVYGFTGAKYGRLPDKRIAAAVTSIGRQSIEKSRDNVEKWYDCKVIYGDSVTSDTPIYVLRDNQLSIVEIGKLVKSSRKWNRCSNSFGGLCINKEYIEFDHGEIFTWSDKGWTKVHRIIRHKLSRHKRIIRVITERGLVDVTDDHSLLLNNGDIISPKVLTLKHKLMCNSGPKIVNMGKDISKTDSFKYGYLFHSSYEIRNNKAYQHLAIATDNFSSIPDSIINGNQDIQNSFIEGIFLSSNLSTDTYKLTIWYDSQIIAAQVKFILECSDISCYFKYRKGKIILIGVLKSTCNVLSSIVTGIEEIEYNGYVYDLTTDNNHFSAGTGDIIVHNTDSIYVKFNTAYDGKEHMKEVFRLGEEASVKISETFKKPMELEFENVMYPFFQSSKKRYACVVWNNPDKYEKIVYKGLQIKRRDYCSYVRKNGELIFETLLLNDIYEYKYNLANINLNLCKTMAKDIILKLLRGQVAINELIISKSLRENYKNQNVPHVAVCEKMRQRDPNNVPNVGDRVQFVYIKKEGKPKNQFEIVDDPKYVIKNAIPLDYYYYYEHQLKSLLESIFGVLDGDTDDVFQVAQDYKPVHQRWASKVAERLAEENELSFNDFPNNLKIKKDDVLKLIKK